jgi:hypothetical protein
VAGARTIIKLAALPVLGLLFFIVPTIVLVGNMNEPDLALLDAPGSTNFHVEQPDAYTVWRRVVGISSNNEFVSQQPELPGGLRVFIRRTDNQTTVPLQESSGSSTQNGTIHHHSLFRAELIPGNYELVAESSAEPVTLVVSRNKASLKGFLLVVGCYLVGALCIVAGLVFIIVALIRRAANPPTVSQDNPPPAANS